MAALDLSDLGLKAKPIYWLNGPATGEYFVEDAGLVAALDRFREAVEGLEAAWLALPVGVREHYDGSTLTLHAHSKRTPAVDDLRAAFRVMEAVNLSEALDHQKFMAIFGLHTAIVEPLLKSAGIAFEWTDPDESYDEDVRAYLVALRDLVERLSA